MYSKGRDKSYKKTLIQWSMVIDQYANSFTHLNLNELLNEMEAINGTKTRFEWPSRTSNKRCQLCNVKTTDHIKMLKAATIALRLLTNLFTSCTKQKSSEM
nr:unnamed protein product [Callosobruchus analis]